MGARKRGSTGVELSAEIVEEEAGAAAQRGPTSPMGQPPSPTPASAETVDGQLTRHQATTSGKAAAGSDEGCSRLLPHDRDAVRSDGAAAI